MSLPDTLSPTTLRQKNGSVRLLDVRTPGEFAASRIPGSHNIPLGDIEAHAEALAKSDTELVLICQSGGRAAMAAETPARMFSPSGLPRMTPRPKVMPTSPMATASRIRTSRSSSR